MRRQRGRHRTGVSSPLAANQSSGSAAEELNCAAGQLLAAAGDGSRSTRTGQAKTQRPCKCASLVRLEAAICSALRFDVGGRWRGVA
ncbi:hypothetical protein M431DRAFT_462075 [Trichoderma harzianum CBS 226.95]|uniref:Uncharacterized protein n=1 Tax=Trichoderma harzianum CBS 226.95 TaxID=983964 RepID=A0A2T4A8L7_TRIHA|nr:hypothetical protein M431DRAFT_462075 [Trichoderma harzianum CBS 226.95]PTB53419.1 hypothetical protein M431DRAFT_462075 [Trichoderma harzianum CBS 226.95]